ncbi:MAG: hypothetical protein GY953_22470 [bacterium]|nr:hypothetical protein [bacterium]
MYTLTRTLSAKRFLMEQIPALGGALIVAEIFYKFHSFTLECLAFLGTWYAFDALVALIRRSVAGQQSR